MKKEELSIKVSNLETTQIKMMEKLDKFGDKLEEVQISIAKLPEALTEKFDDRYASKVYEDSLKRVMWIVVSAIIIAVLALVIKGI
jgi:restriction endonuclease S subunit